MEVFAYFVAAFVIAFGFVIHYGMRRFIKKANFPARECAADISLIIACRNEEKRLGHLLESIQKLSFCFGHFEVLFLDDGSNDNTLTILEEFAKKDASLYSVIEVREKALPAKKGALEKGVSRARYPNIVITDADCSFGSDWLNVFAGKFSQGYDFIIGAASYFQHNGFLNTHICWENFRNRIVSSASAALQLPNSATAMSLGFTKGFFAAAGGYRATAHRLSGDDDLLLREAARLRVKIGWIADKAALVQGPAEISWQNYFRQKARHVNTSHVYSFPSQIFLSLYYSIQFIAVVSVCLIPFSVSFVIPLLTKYFIDSSLAIRYSKIFKYKFSPIQIFTHSFIAESLAPAHFFRSFFWKKNWR